VKKVKNEALGATRIKTSSAGEIPTPPNPEHFVETYSDRKKLYKINSYIKAVAKYAAERDEHERLGNT